jgi:thymidylate kinase
MNREELEARAQSVQVARKDRSDKLPVVVEFAGSPKSGKSTNIEIVAHFFRRMEFKVWAPSEGASKRTPYSLKRNLLAFNTWSLNYAISELLVAYYNVDQPDLVILDRGPFDSIAWMSLLYQRGDLDNREFQIIRDFSLHPKWSKLIKRLYLFTCEPEISLQRENNVKLTHGPGVAMNTDMLRNLLTEYQKLQQELSNYPVKLLDTTNTIGPLETAKQIADDVLNLFTQNI